MNQTGPTDRSHHKLGDRLDDGRTLHRFRQSTLETLDVCLERGRLVLTGQMPRYETAPLARGTALHAGAELFCRDLQAGHLPDLDYTLDVVHATFSELIATDGFDWQGTTEPTVRRFLTQSAELLHNNYMTLQPEHVEWGFTDLVIYEDDQRVITISGTADLYDTARGLMDWKTASRPYLAWEKERWGHQATVYTWAAIQAGLLDPEAETHPFTFLVFVNKSQVETQELTVTRHNGDHAWLRTRLIDLAHLVESDLSVWPKNDASALCSPKFCGAWSFCKGAHYEDGWPKDSRPDRSLEPIKGWTLDTMNATIEGDIHE